MELIQNTPFEFPLVAHYLERASRNSSRGVWLAELRLNLSKYTTIAIFYGLQMNRVQLV